MNAAEYWEEVIAQSLEEHGVTATDEQIQAIATDVQISHDNYGMSFYSPPASDRITVIERECAEKLRKAQSERPGE